MKAALSVVLLALCLPAAGCDDETRGHASVAKSVEPIPFEKLVPLLPRVEGFEAKPPRGKVTPVGEQRTTVAIGHYEKREGEDLQTLDIEIRDGANISSVYAPFAVMAHLRSDGADAHRMRIDIGGHPGMQDWDTKTNSVSVALLVARRFVVTLKGTRIPPGLVRPTLEAIDLKTLASWAGPPPGPAR